MTPSKRIPQLNRNSRGFYKDLNDLHSAIQFNLEFKVFKAFNFVIHESTPRPISVIDVSNPWLDQRRDV